MQIVNPPHCLSTTEFYPGTFEWLIAGPENDLILRIFFEYLELGEFSGPEKFAQWGLSRGFVIFGSREFLTKLKKADMRVKRSFLVFWLLPSVTFDMKARMSSDEMAERFMSPICFWKLPRMNS